MGNKIIIPKSTKFKSSIHDDEFDVVSKQLHEKSLQPTMDIFSSAIYYGRLDIVSMILENRLYQSTYNIMLEEAYDGNQLGVILLLLSYDDTLNPNEIFQRSCSDGRDEYVTLLISDSRIDPTLNNHICIQYAVSKNYSKIVKTLLSDSRTNPMVNNGALLNHAAAFGYIDVLKCLISSNKTKPDNDNWSILKYAAFNGHHETCQYILGFNPCLSGDASPLSSIINYNTHNSNDLQQAQILAMCYTNPSFDITGIDAMLTKTVKMRHIYLAKCLIDDSRCNYEINCSTYESILSEAALTGDYEIFKLIASHPKAESLKNNHLRRALIAALSISSISIVEHLLKLGICEIYEDIFPDDHLNMWMIIQSSIEFSHELCFRSILEFFSTDIGYYGTQMLHYAISMQRPKHILELMSYDVVDLTVNNNELLHRSIELSWIDVLTELMGRIDLVLNNDVLITLLKFGNSVSTNILLQSPRVRVTSDFITTIIGTADPETLELLLKSQCNEWIKVYKFCDANGYHNITGKILEIALYNN